MPKQVNGKMVVCCSSCKHVDKKFKEEKLKDEVKGQEEVGVVEDEKDNLPETEVECPKCGNKKAGYWLVQTRASDEPETKFLKCTKCKHIWRDYS